MDMEELKNDMMMEEAITSAELAGAVSDTNDWEKEWDDKCAYGEFQGDAKEFIRNLLSSQKSSLEQRIDDIEKLKAIIKSSLHREMVEKLEAEISDEQRLLSQDERNSHTFLIAQKNCILGLKTAIQISNQVLGGGEFVEVETHYKDGNIKSQKANGVELLGKEGE